MKKIILLVAIVFSVFATLRLEEILGVGYPIFRYYNNFAHHALNAGNIDIFLVHIPAGIVTLLSGAAAIWISPKSPWHSRVGYLYLVSAIICAVFALVITVRYHVDPLIVSAYGAGGAIWLYFNLKVVWCVLRGPDPTIVRYAILSYSFALLFVSARICLYIAFLFGDRATTEIFPTVYGSIIWGLFWVHLFAGEFIAFKYYQRRNLKVS